MAKGKASAIELAPSELRELESLARRRSTRQALALRARIVLAAAEGGHNGVIAERLGILRGTVGKWRERFARLRLDGFNDEPRPGAPRQIGDNEIADTIRRTLESRPRGRTHWSLRSMAEAVGHAPSKIAPKTLRLAAEAGRIEAIHPLPDGPWIFAHDALITPAARSITERARQNPKYPTGSSLHQQNLFTSITQPDGCSDALL